MKAKHTEGWVAEATQLPRLMGKEGPASFYSPNHRERDFPCPGTPPKAPGMPAAAAPGSQPLQARQRLGTPALH